MNIQDNKDGSKNEGSESEYKGDTDFSGFQGLTSGVQYLENDKSKTHTTFSEYRLYFDNCVTYHSVFIETFLYSIGDADEVIHGHCNTGTTIETQER